MPMRSLFSIIPALWALALCCSCGNYKTGMTAGQSAKFLQVACGKVDVDAATPHIDWFMTEDALSNDRSDITLPVAYKAYVLEQNQLRRFFDSAAVGTEGLKTVVPLPAGGCQLFQVKRSSAMSEALRNKYPQLVSLSGNSVKYPENDIRLDFDGTKMSGQIIWRSEVFLITPVAQGKDTYYIVYKKEDSGISKEGFESVTR